MGNNNNIFSFYACTNMFQRDLKTTNVFLTRDRRVKLGDFGISKVMTSMLQALTVVGTPYYISPEMVSSVPIVNNWHAQ